MRRVMIVGQPGAGKSTLAARIGAITGLPVVHIDHIHWRPGWQERPRAEKTAMCRAVHAQERWVFEGGHSVTWPERLARCDTVIWLDIPVCVRLWRVLVRSWRYRGRSHPDLPTGCPEQFDPSFLRYIWATRKTARARLAALLSGVPDGTRAFFLRGDGDVQDLLRVLEGEASDRVRSGDPARPASP